MLCFYELGFLTFCFIDETIKHKMINVSNQTNSKHSWTIEQEMPRLRLIGHIYYILRLVWIANFVVLRNQKHFHIFQRKLICITAQYRRISAITSELSDIKDSELQ